MVMERMPACMREGTPGCTELGKRALVAPGDASEHTGLGWGRGRPAGRSGSPPPARRAGPSRPAGPAGAARGRHWACSDGGQVAPRASFCAARTRDLPGRPAPPDAAGTGRRDPSGLGAGHGATGGRGRSGRCPAPTLPQARGERASGLADAAAPGSRRLVGAGRGDLAALTWWGAGGREQAGPGGAGSRRSIRKGWIPTSTVFLSFFSLFLSHGTLPSVHYKKEMSPLAQGILGHKPPKCKRDGHGRSESGHLFTLVSSAWPAPAQDRLSHSSTSFVS